jgi:predicted alpha/beta hydrolase family esterase
MATKVYLIHGFEASPNGAWRAWLLRQLADRDVYACALPMPSPAEPREAAWVTEIARVVERDRDDDVFLVGHSLGVPAILRFVESAPADLRIKGVVLVAGPIENIGKPRIQDFFMSPFDFAAIRAKLGAATVIHAKDDANVPYAHAERLARELGAELVTLETGAHLNSAAGIRELPSALAALEKMLA